MVNVRICLLVSKWKWVSEASKESRMSQGTIPSRVFDSLMYKMHPKFWVNKLHAFNILMYKMHSKFSFFNLTQNPLNSRSLSLSQNESSHSFSACLSSVSQFRVLGESTFLLFWFIVLLQLAFYSLSYQPSCWRFQASRNSSQPCYFSFWIWQNLNILMYKMHPFFWSLIWGQESASYTWDGKLKLSWNKKI